MDLLLDGSAVLRAVYAPSTLHSRVRELLQAEKNRPLLSYATIWELLAKIERGRIPFVLDSTQESFARILRSGVILLRLEQVDLVSAATLPDHHRDPFDRMLVAQAQRLGATIISSDRTLPLYGIPVVPL